VFGRRRSRIQQAIVEIGEASSGFLQFVAMAFRGTNAAGSSTVIATRCPLMRPRTRIRYIVRLHVPFARDVLSQHSLAWDEWSSPGELIHPGDLAGIASITSSEEELDFAIAVMAIRGEAPGNRGGDDSLRSEYGLVTTAGRGNGTRVLGRDQTWQPICRGACAVDSGSGQPLVGLPQSVAAPAEPPGWLPGACRSE
jgi:hypothetical protein